MYMCFGHMSGAYRLNKLASETLDPLYSTQRHGPSQSGSNEFPFLTGTLLSYKGVKNYTPRLTAGPLLISWSITFS